jgi:hypothetical protein
MIAAKVSCAVAALALFRGRGKPYVFVCRRLD